MNFGQAIEALKAGKKIARSTTNVSYKLLEPHIDYKTGVAECFLEIAKETNIPNPYNSKYIVDVDVYLAKVENNKITLSNTFILEDVLAEDWIIIE